MAPAPLVADDPGVVRPVERAAVGGRAEPATMTTSLGIAMDGEPNGADYRRGLQAPLGRLGVGLGLALDVQPVT